MREIILDLCGGTGAWSRPYAEAGYDVRVIDIKTGQDVRKLKHLGEPVHGILAAPPCTHLSGSGARWWAEKGETALLDALSVVDACLRVVMFHKPEWWALENPVGRISRYLGKPKLVFQPYEYGDPWVKKTCVWGEFNIPPKRPVPPDADPKVREHIWRMPPSSDRPEKRSITPPGFARAFFEANR